MIKFMSEKAGEFFRNLEEIEKSFRDLLLETATTEMESFNNQMQNDLGDLQDQKKAKLPSARDEMLQACTNVNESHVALIQVKEDTMTNQMSAWLRNFFEGHRSKQYVRNRARIQEIKTLVQEIRDEIEATKGCQATDDDD